MKNTENVCIVTWYGSPNFGTNLQAFALSKVLRDAGYSVAMISCLPPFSSITSLLYYYLVNSRAYRAWLRVKGCIFKRNDRKYYLFHGNAAVEKWVRKELPCEVLKFPFEVRRLVERTDCFVVGSDQVWNTFVKFDPTMYLHFAKNKKRISYASSLGASGINPRYRSEVRDLLSKFTHISVRENIAVPVIRELLGRNDVKEALDPTLLLSDKEWEAFSVMPKVSFRKSGDYVLCYVIGDNVGYKNKVLNVWRSSGIKNLIIVPACENPDFQIEGASFCMGISPAEFVWLIRNAKLVCTDSFHATAMSLNLGIKFVELLRFDDKEEGSQNSRIYNILERYRMMSRLYREDSACWLEDVDYSSVHELIKRDRSDSLDWLLRSIEN